VAHRATEDSREFFNGLLAIMKREIDASRTLLDVLKRQKRGLMQKLLTGKWRIPMKEGVPA
jgi:type I restriction enzyme S subunit